jgi:PAS domain S-box-containing protein
MKKKTTRVNLHCHSVCSDGELNPDLLASRLAAAEVEFAALTDHDTLDGLPAFHEALRRHNIGFVAGVEITAELGGREIHLLAYGFDPHHRELTAALRFLRHERLSRRQGPLRRLPSQFPPDSECVPPPGATPTGKIEAGSAIELGHRAGGKVFLAHPFVYATEPEDLTRLFTELRNLGLDGVELPIDPLPENGMATVTALARRHGLAVCAGTDFHNSGQGEKTVRGIDLANEVWSDFVKMLISSPEPPADKPARQAAGRSERPRKHWTMYRPGLILPSLLAIILFVVTVWGMILPSVEELLVDRKRDMIRELTNTATSLLAAARRDEEAGLLSGDQAREKAKADIAALRYGKEGKDYFWLQDMQPRILMHPYRPELNGSDVADFTDPRGVHIFAEFAHLVRRNGKGFIGYVWQWKDDPTRLTAKESYVSGFAPWGWIIGTGMYLDDVRDEIGRIEQNLVYSLAVITALVLLLLLNNLRQNLGVEKDRLAVQDGLLEAEERYRALIEATTEGTLLVLEGRCRYGNPTLLALTGYSGERLELLKLSDLLPECRENEEILRRLERLSDGTDGPKTLEAALAGADGAQRACLVTLNPITLAGHGGIILLIKEILPERAEADLLRKLGLVSRTAAIGIFRARADHPGRIVAMNDTARQLLQNDRVGSNTLSLAAFFGDDGEYGSFRKELLRTGVASQHYLQKMSVARGIRTLALSATLIRDQAGEPSAIDCLLRDATDTVRRATVDKARIEDLQASLLLFLDRDTNGRLEIRGRNSHDLPGEIARAAGPDEVCRACERLFPATRMLVEAGVRPTTVARMTSAVCDAATVRFIELAVHDLGQPPVPFAFIAMGSQGRGEQTLVTDQDNAIIYAARAKMDEDPTVAAYFLALGARVCAWLNEAGYPFCNGKVMADNPDWCKSLPAWQGHFADWIAKAEAKELLDFSICLDFRPVYGAAPLAHELRTSVDRVLDDRPSFIPHLARNALLFKPPFRLLGRIIKSGGPPEEAGRLNFKETMIPLIGFARLYALRHRIYQTGTIDRIMALTRKNILEPADREAFTAAHDVLLRLRFQAQLAKIAAGPPDNCMAIDDIRHMDEAMVKEAFIRIEALQKKIIYDFLGGAEWPGH